MPSTIFHTILGCCAARSMGFSIRKAHHFCWVLCFSNLPDVDFAAGLLTGSLFRFHRSFTHGLYLYVLLFAFFLILVREREPILLAFWLILLHLLADLCSGKQIGFSRSYGMPLLWPLTTKNFALPFTLFPPILKDAIFSFHNLKVVLWEILSGLVFGILLYC